MKIVNLRREAAANIDRYDSVDAFSLLAASGTGAARVHSVYFDAGGHIGRHRAGPAQLFVVIEGSGWVEGRDGVRHDIGCGEAAHFEAGEDHAKGSDSGMAALMVQMTEMHAPSPGRDRPEG